MSITFDKPEERAVISGIGISQVGRRLNRAPLALAVEAIMAAIQDAGLTGADIDGLATWPGRGPLAPGLNGPGIPEVIDALRLNLTFHHGGSDGPGQLSAITTAVMATATGMARHTVVYRTLTESSAQGGAGRGATVSAQHANIVSPYEPRRFTVPFGDVSAATQLGLYAQRHMHEFGTTKEHLGAIAINDRANAALNPHAIYTDPMTMEDYLAARPISTPLGLYDCDVPCDGAVALVISSVETVPDLPRAPIRIEAMGTAIGGRTSFEWWEDYAGMAALKAGAHLWSRTDLTPADVDVAQLYDGFSFLTLPWIEALGFCGRGESGPFVEGGHRIRLGGELPLNTSGGQLSAGRLHGYGHVHEACVQLWDRG